ncbi:hypothetical protein CO675_26935 [Bradyrhizobium sp. C9]|nr:hypothetical protein CO675_26935 [Bradyrhizobium sp. C9]
MEIMHGTGVVRFFFAINNEEKEKIADFHIDIPNGGAGVHAMIEEAHRRMNDVLRQWLYMNEVMRQSYEPKV